MGVTDLRVTKVTGCPENARHYTGGSPVATSFQFGLVVRGQAEAGEDITKRFEETIELVRLAATWS